MTRPTHIHFVRHGAVENPEQLFYGRLAGFPLSAQGRMEAQAAAQALSEVPLAAIFSSPQQRALQTAELIAARHDGLVASACEWIDEIHTPYDGWPMDKVVERRWDVYTGNEPPFETPPDILARTQQFIACGDDSVLRRPLACFGIDNGVARAHSIHNAEKHDEKHTPYC